MTAAIILAGGKASRMGGIDKAFLKISREKLIDRQLGLLRKLFKKIIIVTNSPRKYSHLKDVKIISDIIPNLGPLGGLYSGLTASSSFYNFVVACDMPFLNVALIKYLIDIKDNYDITIPKIDGKRHPLFGIYSKNCIPVIEKMLKQNRLNVSSIFTSVRSHFIVREEIEQFDADLASLVNINTKDDLEAVKEMEGVKLCRRCFPQR